MSLQHLEGLPSILLMKEGAYHFYHLPQYLFDVGPYGLYWLPQNVFCLQLLSAATKSLL